MKYITLYLLITCTLFLSSGVFAKPKDKGRKSVSAYEKVDKKEPKFDVETKLKKLPPGLKKKLLRGKPLPPGWQDKLNKGEVLPQEIIEEAIPAPKEVVDILPETETETKVVVIADKIVRISKATREILDVFNIDN